MAIGVFCRLSSWWRAVTVTVCRPSVSTTGSPVCGCVCACACTGRALQSSITAARHEPAESGCPAAAVAFTCGRLGIEVPLYDYFCDLRVGRRANSLSGESGTFHRFRRQGKLDFRAHLESAHEFAHAAARRNLALCSMPCLLVS